MGFFNEKKKRSDMAGSPALSQEPLSYQPQQQKPSFAPSIHELERKDSKYKRTIRIFRFISRLLSFIANTLMISILSYSLYTYYTTRTRPLTSTSTSTTTSIWPTHITLWPTFSLLGMASVTLLMNIFTLLAYCCSVSAANKVNSYSNWISYIFLGIHVVLWLMAAGAYKVASDGKSLWGWTCSGAADEIAEDVKGFLDFGKLCQSQTVAWYVSILQAIIYLVSFITIVMVLQRERSKKKLGKMRESLNMEIGYDRVELGGMYKQGTRYMPLAG